MPIIAFMTVKSIFIHNVQFQVICITTCIVIFLDMEGWGVLTGITCLISYGSYFNLIVIVDETHRISHPIYTVDSTTNIKRDNIRDFLL